MLLVQEYLREYGIKKLMEEKGIEVSEHKNKKIPLVLLNYSQIHSVQSDLVTQESRGLVLRNKTWDLVAKGFNRFFNWGQFPEEMEKFNWDSFVCQEKKDGTFILLFYFEGEWHLSTRKTFGDGLMDDRMTTWREGVLKAMGLKDLQEVDRYLCRSVSYVLEYCGPLNKVVRSYANHHTFLLAAFQGEREIPIEKVVTPIIFHKTQTYSFKSMSEIEEHLKDKEKNDPTYEGVVIRDNTLRRWKIKQPAYLALHRMKGNGNLFLPKNLLPFVLSGETDELLCYYPEAKESVKAVARKIKKEVDNLLNIYEEVKGIEGQKEFALAVKAKTQMSSIFFNVRKKYGYDFCKESLLTEFRCSGDYLLKVLFQWKI